MSCCCCCWEPGICPLRCTIQGPCQRPLPGSWARPMGPPFMLAPSSLIASGEVRARADTSDRLEPLSNARRSACFWKGSSIFFLLGLGLGTGVGGLPGGSVVHVIPGRAGSSLRSTHTSLGCRTCPHRGNGLCGDAGGGEARPATPPSPFSLILLIRGRR